MSFQTLLALEVLISVAMLIRRLTQILHWILLLSNVLSQNFEPFAKEIGGTFCRYLAYQGLLPRKYFGDCGEQACIWDDWYNAVYSHSGTPTSKRIVVSYAHNGFGNQLWEHSVAFMIAESLKAQLYIAVIPDSLSPDGFSPPNTWSGMAAMERMLPKEFQYEYLPADSPVRKLCDNEPFYLSDRPYDKRNKNYTENFRGNTYSILTDKNPRCVKFLGYFQSLPLCAEDARRLWTPRLVSNFTIKPGPNDVSIYLRCVPRHYHFNDQKFYETILNHISFDKVWLFQAPECPTKLSDNPAKDGLVAGVVRLLISKYNATRWPQYQGTDETSFLLHDLAGLAQSKKLILPLSSWAFWAGFLSNATEIHVNAPPHHANMGAAYPQYIYHNDKTQQYFGRFDTKENDIVYDNKYLSKSHQTLNGDVAATTGAAATPVPGTATATNASTTEPAVAKEATPYKVHFDIV